MLNPKVIELYDINTANILARYAQRMKNAARHVITALPTSEIDGIIFPKVIGIENCIHTDVVDIMRLYKEITLNCSVFDASQYVTVSDYTRYVTGLKEV